MTEQENVSREPESPPDLLAAWIIGIYLVLEVAVLGYVGVMFWLASDMNQLLNFPLHPPGFESLRLAVSPDRFLPFRQLALAACSAGAGDVAGAAGGLTQATSNTMPIIRIDNSIFVLT